MLLRRITTHVKEQNWFAVGLDFFIVVIGILIAFQITAWSERRADNRTLKTALELLRDEIETNIATIDESSKLHSGIAMAGEELLREIRKPELNAVPIELLGEVFFGGYTTDYSTSALTFVLDQEPFQSIQNVPLRQAVAKLPSRMEDTLDDERTAIYLLDNRWVPYISQHVPVEEFWKEVFLIRDEPFVLSTKRSRDYAINATLEFKELASTLEFQNEVVNRIGYQAFVLSEQQLLRDALESALILIEEELD